MPALRSLRCCRQLVATSFRVARCTLLLPSLPVGCLLLASILGDLSLVAVELAQEPVKALVQQPQVLLFVLRLLLEQ